MTGHCAPKRWSSSAQALARTGRFVLAAFAVIVLASRCSAEVIPPEWTTPPSTAQVQRVRQATGALFAQVKDLGMLIKTCVDSLDPAKQQAFSKELAETKKSLERDQARLDALDKRIDELDVAAAASNTGVGAKLEELDKQLAVAKTERDRLAKIEAQRPLDDPDAVKGGFERWIDFTGMKPLYVMLLNNRAIPIDEPYYEFQSSYRYTGSGFRQVTEVKRVSDGEAITTALAPGGCLYKLIEGMDAQKEYVKFFVCGDSIAAYTAASRYLAGKGLPYTWTPGMDKTLYPSDGAPDDSGPGGKK